MIYASFEAHTTSRTESPHTSLVGARQAHDSLLRTVLTSGEVEHAHFFFLDQLAGAPAVRELQQHYGDDRIRLLHLAQLPILAAQNKYVFVSRASQMSDVCRVRAGLGSVAFPVCGIVHSLSWPDLLGGFALNLLRCEAGDTLVVTSRAAEQAVGYALTQAKNWLVSGKSSCCAEGPSIERIPLGVDTARFRPRPKTDCRDVLGLPANATIVLYLGRLSEELKADLEPLISAMAPLCTTYRDLLLIIAGNDHGNYAQRLQAKAYEYGVADQIRINANVSEASKPLLYSAADVFVSPVDNIQESFGLSILEAMASGLPAVASDWSGYRDIIVPESTGFLVRTYWNPIASTMMSWLASEHFLSQRTIIDVVQLRKAIETLILSPNLRRDFAANARKRAESEFDIRVIAHRFVRLWEAQMSAATSRKLRFPGVDYREMFKHYATSELSFDLKVRATDRGLILLEDVKAGIRQLPPLINGDVESLLEASKVNSVSIDERITTGSPVTFEAITWMLKKGFLAVDGPTAPHC